MKEYWGVKRGGNGSNQFKQTRQNGVIAKTTNDIAEAIGETKRNTERLLKLNDLIPELQSLVSSGELGTTAAEQLAYLTPEVPVILPVEVKDVSPEEAEYLLIADNEERRQNDDDPVKKAKRAKFLKEYWGYELVGQ
ncbi:hypothetical protein [Desulfoscipio gibsoniae]